MNIFKAILIGFNELLLYISTALKAIFIGFYTLIQTLVITLYDFVLYIKKQILLGIKLIKLLIIKIIQTLLNIYLMFEEKLTLFFLYIIKVSFYLRYASIVILILWLAYIYNKIYFYTILLIMLISIPLGWKKSKREEQELPRWISSIITKLYRPLKYSIRTFLLLSSTILTIYLNYSTIEYYFSQIIPQKIIISDINYSIQEKIPINQIDNNNSLKVLPKVNNKISKIKNNLHTNSNFIITPNYIWQNEPYTLKEKYAYNDVNDSEEHYKVQTWRKAKIYCRKLNFSGYKDWRLPSIATLQKFYNINSHIDKNSKKVFWSSTTVHDNRDLAYAIDTGGVHWKYDKSILLYIRCVHDNIHSNSKTSLEKREFPSKKNLSAIQTNATNPNIMTPPLPRRIYNGLIALSQYECSYDTKITLFYFFVGFILMAFIMLSLEYETLAVILIICSAFIYFVVIASLYWLVVSVIMIIIFIILAIIINQFLT